MPERDGFHIGTVTVDGRAYRWHYCASADQDTLVLDTKPARQEHLRECKRLAREARKRAEREARRRSLAGLTAYQRERRLEREVIGSAS